MSVQNKEAELQGKLIAAESERGSSPARSRSRKILPIVIIHIVAGILGLATGGYAGFAVSGFLFRVSPPNITSIQAGFAAIVVFFAIIAVGAKAGLFLAILVVQRIILPRAK